MLTVTPSAREYFSRLLNEQATGTGLRLATSNPGTPSADVALNYCPPGDEKAEDEAVDCGDFILFVTPHSMQALDGAIIDFESNETGGELTIRAPGLKGHSPGDDAPLHERVAWVLESRINPMVASHGGHVSLVEITEDRDIVLQFGGGCHGCGMVDVTLKQGIETQLREQLPEIRNVVDATDHSKGDKPYFE
ncbi:MAG: NifU family protein [Wenzhouxiangellaceae bacterium]|nr:NifU family protein [Wenzhouxiangellaceae bacterium]